MAQRHSQQWCKDVFRALYAVMQEHGATPDDLACCIAVELAEEADTAPVQEFRRLADLWEKEGGAIATHGAEVH